jgi:hypothetical protein
MREYSVALWVCYGIETAAVYRETAECEATAVAHAFRRAYLAFGFNARVEFASIRVA